MPSPTACPRRMLLVAALAVAAVAAAVPALQRSERAARPVAAASPATAAPANPLRVCVTRAGLCPIGAVRAGDPCTCSDPLRGTVPGHVETVGGPPSAGSRRDWPGSGAEELLYGP
ncbi:MAG: hypothetical protein U1E17_19050 [Geminicoccaceae bacterium]